MGLETLLIAAAVGAGAFGASKAFGGGDKGGSDAPAPTPAPLPEPPKPEAAAEGAQEQVRKKRAAQSKTVFTDPLGVSGQADIVRKTLTGQ